MDNDLPITVPQELHDAMAAELGEPFAASYLCGAILDRGVLFPRTDYARRHLAREPKAVRVLQAAGIHLGEGQRERDRIEIAAVTDARKRYERTGHF